jgi:hypothetical protein
VKNTREPDILASVNFDSTTRVNEVWSLPFFHVEALHRDVRDRLLSRLSKLQAGASSLACLLLGASGSGRTHLLGSLREEIFRRPEFHGASFLWIDLRNLRPTDGAGAGRMLLEGTLDSLRRAGPRGEPQYRLLLLKLLSFLGKEEEACRAYLRLLESSGSEWLERDVSKICGELKKERRVLPGGLRGLLLALFALNCSDERSDLAWRWLRKDEEKNDGKATAEGPGQNTSEWSVPERKHLSLRECQRDFRELFAALIQLLTLRGPVLLAVDQTDEVMKSGLSAAGELRKELARVVGDVEGVFAIVSAPEDFRPDGENTPDCFSDRETLNPLSDAMVAQMLIASRLDETFHREGFSAPWSVWPFRPEAFIGCSLSPRELLTLCARHRDQCLRRGEVTELASFEDFSSAGFFSPEPHSEGRPAAALHFDEIIEVEPRREEIVLGYSSSMPGQIAPVVLPVQDLRLHGVLLADGGAGKTTLLRRILEESVAFGIPSVLLEESAGSRPAGEPVVSLDLSGPQETDLASEMERVLEGKARIFAVNFGGLLPGEKKTLADRLLKSLLTSLMPFPLSGDNVSPARLKVLLAIDDAYGFAFSGGTPMDGDGLSLLMERAKRLGLGILFSSRRPDDVDAFLSMKVGTFFLGRAGVPRILSKIEARVQGWGGPSGTIPHLKTGEFLMRSGETAPVTLRVVPPRSDRKDVPLFH